MALLMVLLLDADVSSVLLVSLTLTVVDDGTPIGVGDNAVLANNASCAVPFKPPPAAADDDEPQ